MSNDPKDLAGEENGGYVCIGDEQIGGGRAVALAYLNQHPGDGHYLSIAPNAMLSNDIRGLSPISYTDVYSYRHADGRVAALVAKTGFAYQNGQRFPRCIKKDPDRLALVLAQSGRSCTRFARSSTKAVGGDIKKLRMVIFKTSTEALLAVVGRAHRPGCDQCFQTLGPSWKPDKCESLLFLGPDV